MMAQAQISRFQGPGQGQALQHQSYPMALQTPGNQSKPISYPNTMTDFDAPAGYPGSGPQMRQSLSQYATGQFVRGSAMPVSMGPRSNSRGNLAGQSRSLGASKASLASEKLGKTSIRREFQDKKLRRNLKSPNYGKGRTPFIIGIVLFVLGGVLIICGITMLLLRFHNNIMLSIDKGEIIGPLLIALGIAAIAGGIKFYYDAYTISNKERSKIKFLFLVPIPVPGRIAPMAIFPFTPASESLICATTVNSKNLKAPPGDILLSGTITANAVSRIPHGSMGSLNNI